jgi:hypothetical protein
MFTAENLLTYIEYLYAFMSQVLRINHFISWTEIIMHLPTKWTSISRYISFDTLNSIFLVRKI